MAGLKLGNGDDFYFYLSPAWQGGDLNGRTSGKGGVEISGIDGVHVSKAGEVRHENSGLHNVGESHPIGAEDASDIFKNARCLLRDAAGNQLSRGRVQRNLSRAIQRIAGSDGLGIRTDGCWGFR